MIHSRAFNLSTVVACLARQASNTRLCGIQPPAIARYCVLLALWFVHGRPVGQAMTDTEKECLRTYFYHIAAARGSGEFALRHLLAPGAWAHLPLQERLQELKVCVQCRVRQALLQ
jgi:hypothetical protein